MNVVREIQRLNERELELGVSEKASWHAAYQHSAYVFLGGLDFQLTEGDIICIASQSHTQHLLTPHILHTRTSHTTHTSSALPSPPSGLSLSSPQ